MILMSLSKDDIATCWPRTSGDDPICGYVPPVRKELAPHERG